MKIPNAARMVTWFPLSLARIVSEDSQPALQAFAGIPKSSKDS